VAQTNVQNAGFTPNLIYRIDPKHPNGTVIAQSPLGGSKADPGSTVTLTVSQGPGSTTVPSVAGLPKADAIRVLKRQQLKVARTVTQGSNDVPAGEAIRTDPPATTYRRGPGSRCSSPAASRRRRCPT
jgi:serine/threonine-protein kinase